MSTLDMQQLSQKKVTVPVEPEFIIVHYGDFFSGESRSLYPVFKELKRSLGDRLQYIFRHYPFRKDRTMSLSAAMACEAAGLQGRFWEMHDILFEEESKIRNSAFLELAMDLGLDGMRFKRDFHRPDLLERILSEYILGACSGVDHAGTLFINGHRFVDLREAKYITNACDQSIGKYPWA